jgi:hypothetical protein
MDVLIPCPCPGADADEIRHPDGDTVTLADKLTFDEAMACKQAMLLVGAADEDPDAAPRRLAAIIRQYLFSGIKSWTLMNGKAIPVGAAAIERYILSDFGVANLVSSEAEALYNPQVLVPLAGRASRSSPPTRTAELTSAPKALIKSPRKRSSPSSITTIQTDDTATTTTSLDGDSSSSRSSA